MRLDLIESIVCEGADYRLTEYRKFTLADGREYEVALIHPIARRCFTFRHTFKRMALKPVKETEMTAGELDSFPTVLAKVRFQYCAGVLTMPAEVVGLYKDVMSEHVAVKNPEAFDAVKIGRQATAYMNSVKRMGPATLPVSLH